MSENVAKVTREGGASARALRFGGLGWWPRESPCPYRALFSRFGFGIYFTLQDAAHFSCYDGAVLGTIPQGAIAPLCGYCLGYLICFFGAVCGIVARLSAGASGRSVGVSGGGSAVSGALGLGASAGARVGVWGGCREVGRGRWMGGWGAWVGWRISGGKCGCVSVCGMVGVFDLLFSVSYDLI